MMFLFLLPRKIYSWFAVGRTVGPSNDLIAVAAEHCSVYGRTVTNRDMGDIEIVRQNCNSCNPVAK